MKIKIFGKLTDIINDNFKVEFPLSVEEFRTILTNQYPELKSMDFGIAINQEIIHDPTIIIHPHDELALLPPFSGG